jgi:hypothetical protein
MPTITIPLTQGQVTVIDADDLNIVAPHKWYAVLLGAHNGRTGSFYAATKMDRRMILLHRLLMGATDARRVDHVDGDTLNNQRDNLRFATAGQNKSNSRPHWNNRSGFKGVYRRGKYLRWSAQVRHNDHLYDLGSHSSPEEAARAYDAKARELFGEFARCNFPE